MVDWLGSCAKCHAPFGLIGRKLFYITLSELTDDVRDRDASLFLPGTMFTLFFCDSVSQTAVPVTNVNM